VGSSRSGAYPVALVGAALLVPALVVLYVYSVDVYEETPIPVIGLTMIWGAVWGVLIAVAADSLVATPRIGGSRWSEIVLLGVVVPLVGLAVMVAGPLILLRDRRYNDVVDGASFGVASASRSSAPRSSPDRSASSPRVPRPSVRRCPGSPGSSPSRSRSR
jgi:hypothetical protein